ncbi:hypothetical protein TWF706_002233 [Orbilia oligospora]|nr:hypothetical protein TWF706_002233 [Orbilia oligospora]
MSHCPALHWRSQNTSFFLRCAQEVLAESNVFLTTAQQPQILNYNNPPSFKTRNQGVVRGNQKSGAMIVAFRRYASSRSGAKLGLDRWIQRSRVLALWREILRTVRHIEDPATREEMRSWARHEFKRNKNVEEMVSISSFRELHGVIFAVLFEPNIMSPWVHHVESADANSLPDISKTTLPPTPAYRRYRQLYRCILGPLHPCICGRIAQASLKVLSHFCFPIRTQASRIDHDGLELTQ